MDKRYKALLQERADLVAEGRRIFEAAEATARDLTEAEKTRDDEINARLSVPSVR
jgi:predicted phage gp36 major capsid-like protein